MRLRQVFCHFYRLSQTNNVETDVSLVFNDTSPEPLPENTDVVETLTIATSDSTSGLGQIVVPGSISVTSEKMVILSRLITEILEQSLLIQQRHFPFCLIQNYFEFAYCVHANYLFPFLSHFFPNHNNNSFHNNYTITSRLYNSTSGCPCLTISARIH